MDYWGKGGGGEAKVMLLAPSKIMVGGGDWPPVPTPMLIIRVVRRIKTHKLTTRLNGIGPRQ